MNQAEFSLRTPVDSTLTLAQAILIYAGRSGGVLATVHDIEDVDGDPVLGAGQGVTPRAATDMARALCEGVAHGGFLPETVLYLDGDLIVWWVPPADRHVAFRVGAEHAEAFGGAQRGEQVPHPGLVFAASNAVWRAWAVKGRARPTLGTAIYQAPYFNVDSYGNVCQGSVQVPGGTTAARLDAWNDAFFRSYFTHPNVAGRLVSYRGGAYRLWRDLLDGKYRRFPERVLVATGTTLADLLSLKGDLP